MAQRKQVSGVECMFCEQMPCVCGVSFNTPRKRIDIDAINRPTPKVEPEPKRKYRRKEDKEKYDEQPAEELPGEEFPVIPESEPKERRIFIGSLSEAKAQSMGFKITPGLGVMRKEAEKKEEIADQDNSVTYPEALRTLFSSGIICVEDMITNKGDLEMSDIEVGRLIWNAQR